MNKRGIEEEKGVNWGIALLVLVAAAVIIYIGYDRFMTVSQYADDDLTPLAAACNSYAVLGDTGKIAYCITPRAIKYGRETRYVNCEFPKIDQFITNRALAGGCDKASSFTTMCSTLQADLGNNFAARVVCVNDERCPNSKVGSCGGAAAPATNAPAA